MDLEHSADARAVVDAVIKLAHALGLKVVAEGVENQRQQQVLVQMGCDELQGFLFAKPMSARALMLWADQRPLRRRARSSSPRCSTRPATACRRRGGAARLIEAAARGDAAANAARPVGRSERFVAAESCASSQGAGKARRRLPYIHVRTHHGCAVHQEPTMSRQPLLRGPDLQPHGRRDASRSAPEMMGATAAPPSDRWPASRSIR